MDEENEEEVTNPMPAEAKKVYEVLSRYATPQGFSYQTLQSLDEVGDAVNSYNHIFFKTKVHEFISTSKLCPFFQEIMFMNLYSTPKLCLTSQTLHYKVASLIFSNEK